MARGVAPILTNGLLGVMTEIVSPGAIFHPGLQARKGNPPRGAQPVTTKEGPNVLLVGGAEAPARTPRGEGTDFAVTALTAALCFRALRALVARCPSGVAAGLNDPALCNMSRHAAAPRVKHAKVTQRCQRSF